MTNPDVLYFQNLLSFDVSISAIERMDVLDVRDSTHYWRSDHDYKLTYLNLLQTGGGYGPHLPHVITNRPSRSSVLGFSPHLLLKPALILGRLEIHFKWLWEGGGEIISSGHGTRLSLAKD